VLVSGAMSLVEDVSFPIPPIVVSVPTPEGLLLVVSYPALGGVVLVVS
jgi:hypothetical protein